MVCLLRAGAADAARARLQGGHAPAPDPDDGLTFRVLCMHDVRDNLRASFADMPDQFAIETRTLTDLFSGYA